LGGTKEFTEWAIVRLGDRPHCRRTAFRGSFACGRTGFRGQAVIAAVIGDGRMPVGMMLASARAGAMEMSAVEMLAKDAVPPRPEQRDAGKAGRKGPNREFPHELPHQNDKPPKRFRAAERMAVRPPANLAKTPNRVK
jgi:hypothetical protein